MEAELWNFQSQNILCAEAELQVTEHSKCGMSLVPYAIMRKTRKRRAEAPGSKPSWWCYYFLAVAHNGIFCLLRYYQAVTNQLCYDRDPDIRQTSCPKATRTKLPKGQHAESNASFQPCKRVLG